MLAHVYFPDPDFLATALIVVLAPGTGVVYTLSAGVFMGARASMAAAIGCTVGIVPHLAAAILGLAALLHASAVAFQAFRFVGIAYLLYLAWGLWTATGTLRLGDPATGSDPSPGPSFGPSFGKESKHRHDLIAIAVRGVLINTLNPKLSIFFLAFLPQFVPESAADAGGRMVVLGGVFMLLTLVVFVGYGLAAHAVRARILSSARATRWMGRGFAGAFVGFAVRLGLAER